MRDAEPSSELPKDAEGLVREFHDPLRRFVANRVIDPADVDDVLQDVYLRLVEHRDSLRAVEHLRGFLHHVARNAIADLHRRRARSATRDRKFAGEPDEAEATGDSPEGGREFLAACLAPIVRRLDEPYREAISLVELDGLTQAEAADRVGISLSGMKSRVQRGRERLRALVLACCEVELDRRRSISNVESKRTDCAC